MKVLVTGCAGRLGTAAVADLAAQGIDVVGVDVRAPEAPGGLDLRLCDITVEGALAPHLAGVDAVLHLAAIPVPRLGTPPAIFDLNGAGTFRLFQACTDAGVRRVVVASSINAIGYYFGTVPFELDYLPVDEDHRRRPSDAYSFSKQVTEDIGAYFGRREGIANACLRFGAGLATLEQMRERDGLRLARDTVRELAALPEAEAVAEVARWRAAFDATRRARGFEGGPRQDDLTPAQRRTMALRHNYFSFIEIGQACRAMRLALTAAFDGHHTLFVVDRRNSLGLDAQLLARRLYPGVPVLGRLEGDAALVTWQRAADLLGFESTIGADAVWGASE